MPDKLGLIRRKLLHYLRYPARRADENAMLLGQLHLKLNPPPLEISRLADAELKVFSQFGEDGIIQYLIQRVPIVNHTFIEFGVEDYRESNTRFLLRNNNWSGLVIDGDPLNIQSIQDERISVYHDLRSVCAFVTRENINEIISVAGFAGDVGLLSVDVDGNDYWIWDAITAVTPRIVVCEYNAVFGKEIAVTVPYSPNFRKENAHFSRLYFGASLGALCDLAGRKGYRFVGCTSSGNDAFFVRNEYAGDLKALTAEEGFVDFKGRDSRGPQGEKTFLRAGDRVGAISHLSVMNVRSGETVPLSRLLG